ncbi:MAG TPA: ribonuclease J [Firmicutes bacterium]|nr:ribonuclease J [Bacillota bacterium]
MSEDVLSLIPLGGIREIGKNISVFEYGNDILVLDCGIAFPDEEQFGIDLVIPDITYLEENKDRVRAFVLTHGHEDHIGALPYVLPRVNAPVYGTKLTIGLLKRKLEEHWLLKKVSLNVVEPGPKVKLGPFQVEWVRTNHSIPDGCGIAIHTPRGIIFHSGDFKIDPTPIDGRVADLSRLGRLGSEGVLAMLCDATNAERTGYTPSEKVVGEALDRVFATASGRLLIATFASNIHRLQQIITAAHRYGRKVAVAGRSMRNNIVVAEELGYLNVPKGIIVELDEMNNLANDRVVLITTGSQGEPMAALTLIANGDHRQVQIKPGDTVVISATPIPGNERVVGRTIDNLFRLGAKVIYGQQVHVSGHASQEELKLMLNLVRPHYAIPFHGEYRHLNAFKQVAMEVGIPEERVIVPELGERLEVTRNGIARRKKVQAGPVLIDGLGIGDVGNIVLRDRQTLAENGVLVVVVVMEKQTGKFISGPDIVTRGFVYVRESEHILEEAKKRAAAELEAIEEREITEWSLIKSRLKNVLADYFYEATARRPIILPIIIEI